MDNHTQAYENVLEREQERFRIKHQLQLDSWCFFIFDKCYQLLSISYQLLLTVDNN